MLPTLGSTSGMLPTGGLHYVIKIMHCEDCNTQRMLLIVVGLDLWRRDTVVLRVMQVVMNL